MNKEQLNQVMMDDGLQEAKEKVRKLKWRTNYALGEMLHTNCLTTKVKYFDWLALSTIAEERFNSMRKKITVDYSIELGQDIISNKYELDGSIEVYDDMTDEEIKNEILKLHKLKIDIIR